ncbi:hypothetical protein SAMN04487931_103133 [Desulfobacula phenolica]|uniref:Uncharacterized protein n=2 Tax=Desulfobacula phenolica TaxID=90732 RepID=A0A1H2EI10_9BACT|nr:hypothetical protein SAMN04487931_103133 [Desulfobacula phenolica]
MKTIITLLCVFSMFVFLSSPLIADEYEFKRLEMSFKNFMTCELTRTNAIDHFNGKPFKITMIDLFDIQNESDLKIITGAIECFVGDKHLTLYAAVGLKIIMDREQVVYYTIRDKDFSILATELIKFPYKERCKWSPYWLDID